jgi:hypothetical protein
LIRTLHARHIGGEDQRREDDEGPHRA